MIKSDEVDGRNVERCSLSGIDFFGPVRVQRIPGCETLENDGFSDL